MPVDFEIVLYPVLLQARGYLIALSLAGLNVGTRPRRDIEMPGLLDWPAMLQHLYGVLRSTCVGGGIMVSLVVCYVFQA
ncbi:MAG: hypothetical protein VCD66_04965, partial [Alphaproteobacteria bacterium]